MDEYALCNPAYSTVINYEIFLHLSNLLNDIFILTYHMSLYLAICWSSWLLLVNSTIVLLEIWSWVYQIYPEWPSATSTFNDDTNINTWHVLLQYGQTVHGTDFWHLPQQLIPLAETGQRSLELDCYEEQWRQIIVGVGALHLRRLLYP